MKSPYTSFTPLKFS